MPSLYRRILGPDFDRLSPALRRFHDVESQWQGQATFKVTRGKGWLRNMIASLGRLPPSREEVEVHLRIVAEKDGERWIRSFGNHRLVSFQRAWKGLMVESFGGITLGFRLEVEDGALRLVPARAWLFGIPWPRWLAPSGDGIEVGKGDVCDIIARAYAPLLGLLVQYEGEVRGGPVPP